jgi:hypothetical protein
MNSYFGSSEEAMDIIKAIGARNIRIAYLEDALRDILYEVTQDTAGLPRDELLDVVSAVKELAEGALEKEIKQ